MSKPSVLMLSLFLPSLLITGCQSVPIKNVYGEEKVDQHKSHVNTEGSETLMRCRFNIREAEEVRARLIKMSEATPFLDVLSAYNDILVYLDASGSQASLFKEVHPDKKIRDDAAVCEQEVEKFRTDLSLDKDVFNVLERGETAQLTGEDARMLEKTLSDFRRGGVDKDDATRERIKVLSADLTKLSQEFGENIRNDRFVIKVASAADLAGLPPDFIAAHPPGADGIEISTDYPDFQPFMQYAENEQHRKDLSMKYLNRGTKNGPILQSILEKRHELAQLLGYPNYADYQVKNKMIKNGADILPFIDKVSQLAKAGADKEYQELLKFKQKTDSTATVIQGYESAFIDQGYKKEKFAFDSQSVRPYFPYNQVRDGLLTVTSKIFDISYKPVISAKVWHDSVDVYDVFDGTGKIGRIFLDMHSREGKYKHAAQFTVVSGLLDRQYPEGALVCNFPDPRNGDALMEHDQVVTMFHEFGHLLHHVFAGKHKWIPLSGVATEWDFVEAPSQFMEEFAWSPQVLQMFAKHYQTKEPIPAELVTKLREAEEFGKALSVSQQMFYAALSAEYHSQNPRNFDLLETMKSLQTKYSYYPYREGTRFIDGFGHLDGYGAMYYTYTWSLSRAKDIFEKFSEAPSGLMDPDVARSYRDQVLSPGGAKDAAVLLENFLGRPFSFGAYERWLTSDFSLSMN